MTNHSRNFPFGKPEIVSSVTSEISHIFTVPTNEIWLIRYAGVTNSTRVSLGGFRYSTDGTNYTPKMFQQGTAPQAYVIHSPTCFMLEGGMKIQTFLDSFTAGDTVQHFVAYEKIRKS